MRTFPTVDFRISLAIVLGIEMHDVLIRDRLKFRVWQVAPNVAPERVSSRLGGLQEVETSCRLYFDGLGGQKIRDGEDEIGALDGPSLGSRDRSCRPARGSLQLLQELWTCPLPHYQSQRGLWTLSPDFRKFRGDATSLLLCDY